ncbi:MAG: DUF928 domain-containing protein [Okeania sp. SIO1H6]|nr:DUF928 domain-containing protein [Okeania sp. SIO1H6]
MYILNKLLILCALSLSLTTLVYFPLEAFGNTSNNSSESKTSQNNRQTSDMEYIDTKKAGKAGNIVGGGSMGKPCGEVEPSQLKFLIPRANGGVLGLTTESHPTFWFYIPYKSEEFHSIEFVLEDDDEYEYIDEIPSTSQSFPKLMQVSILQTEAPLETGKNYIVSLYVYCEDPETASNPTQPIKVSVIGNVEREPISPELQSQLDQAGDDLRQQAVIYAKYSIWFDALRIIGELRQQEPNNPQYQEDWNKLLGDINMKIDE